MVFPSLFTETISVAAGYLYPAYASYNALKSKNIKLIAPWLMYWSVLGTWHSVAYVCDIFIFCYAANTGKCFAPFFIYFDSIDVEKGALVLYKNLLLPLFQKHENEIDKRLAEGGQLLTASLKKGFNSGSAYLQRIVAESVIAQSAAASTQGQQPPPIKIDSADSFRNEGENEDDEFISMYATTTTAASVTKITETTEALINSPAAASSTSSRAATPSQEKTKRRSSSPVPGQAGNNNTAWSWIFSGSRQKQEKQQ